MIRMVVVVVAAVSLCWFNVDILWYCSSLTLRPPQAHTHTRFCESTEFRELYTKMRITLLVYFFSRLNRNWCTDNRIAFSVDKMIWIFCCCSYVSMYQNFYIVIILALEHHHSIDKKKINYNCVRLKKSPIFVTDNFFVFFFERFILQYCQDSFFSAEMIKINSMFVWLRKLKSFTKIPFTCAKKVTISKAECWMNFIIVQYHHRRHHVSDIPVAFSFKCVYLNVIRHYGGLFKVENHRQKQTFNEIP